MRAETSASHQGRGMSRQEGVEGSKDRICAPGSHRARRVLPAVGEEVVVPVPVFLQRLGERQGAQALSLLSGTRLGLVGPVSLLFGHVCPAVTACYWVTYQPKTMQHCGLEALSLTDRPHQGQADPAEDIAAFPVCRLR